MVKNKLSVDSLQTSLSGKKFVIVKNYYPLEKDTRLIKLLEMLRDVHSGITYLGWDRDSTGFPSKKPVDNKHYREIILQKNAPFGPTSYLFLPLWWLFVFRYLMKSEWDLVHVVNFPSITPAIFAAKLRHKLVVYDIEDTSVDLLPFRGLLRTLGMQLERIHTKYVDAVILVDEMQNEEFSGIPNSNCTVVYDSPRNVSNLPETKEGDDDFKIFYAGYLNKEGHLNIESVLDAVQDIEHVKVTIAGEGNLVEVIKAKASLMPNKIRYLGWISYDEVLNISCSSDLLFSLRDPYPLVHRYICGSKFLEALMCGKPLLVNKGTSTAQKVANAQCGLLVDAHNIQEVSEAIQKLRRDRKLWEYLALNSRRAYDQKYSWELMKHKLLNLYSVVLTKSEAFNIDHLNKSQLRANSESLLEE